MAEEEEAWKQYPANWSRDDNISLNATDSLRRLEDPEGVYFADEDDEDINVRVTDVNERTYLPNRSVHG